MLEFQEKKKLRNILYSKITLLFLIFILIFIVRATINVYHKQRISERNLIKTKKEVTKLENIEKKLNSEIERLKTEKGTEEEIRKKFMVGRVGEEVIVIVDDSKIDNNLNSKNVSEKSFFSKLLDFFR